MNRCVMPLRDGGFITGRNCVSLPRHPASGEFLQISLEISGNDQMAEPITQVTENTLHWRIWCTAQPNPTQQQDYFGCKLERFEMTA